MGCYVRRVLSWLLLLGAIVLGLALGLGIFHPPSAAAAIRYVEEAPQQFVVQSRQTLKDQHGYSWQAIAFKRRFPDGTINLDLRLVGFPGVVVIDHSQPLTLTNSLGKTWTAVNSSERISQENKQLPPTVTQYDLQPWLVQVPAAIPLTLIVPTIDHASVHLAVAPAVLQEWQQVAFNE